MPICGKGTIIYIEKDCVMSDESSSGTGMSFTDFQQMLNQYQIERQKTLDANMKTLADEGLDAVFLASGWGTYNHQITNNFSKANRFGTRFVMDNYLKTGYTFITRPELNLSSLNLRTDRIMNLLNTNDPTDIKFAIRAYLDTRFARRNLAKVISCPYIDYRSPFFTLLTNNLTDFSGSPQYQLRTYTDDAGFYGESQSMVIGSDSYSTPFDLNLTFIDPIGGPIEATMKFWMRYSDLVANKGVAIMYPDQINERILNYSVSIYRFIMDPSFRYIKKWAKYTGCVPISRPGAAIFDYSAGDVFVDSLRKFSIGFRCLSGHVDEDDPIVIDEFNSLVEKYFPPVRCIRGGTSGSSSHYINRTCLEGDELENALKANNLVRNPLLPEYNYTGVPYITDTKNGLRLDFISQSNELDYTKAIPVKNPDTGFYQTEYLRLAQAAISLMDSMQAYDEKISELIETYNTQVSQDIAGVSQSTSASSNILYV